MAEYVPGYGVIEPYTDRTDNVSRLKGRELCLRGLNDFGEPLDRPAPEQSRCGAERLDCIFLAQADRGGKQCRQCRHWLKPDYYLPAE